MTVHGWSCVFHRDTLFIQYITYYVYISLSVVKDISDIKLK